VPHRGIKTKKAMMAETTRVAFNRNGYNYDYDDDYGYGYDEKWHPAMQHLL
jgi:hypothetical protein